MRVIGGEPLTPYAAATKSEPALQNLIGSYVVTRDDWYDDDWRSMAEDSLLTLTLGADGCFTFQDRMHRPTNAFPVLTNEIGKTGVYTGDGVWTTAVRDFGWGQPTWETSLNFEHPESYVTSFILCNQKSPYNICKTLGDPDDGQWVIFEAVETLRDRAGSRSAEDY